MPPKCGRDSCRPLGLRSLVHPHQCSMDFTIILWSGHREATEAIICGEVPAVRDGLARCDKRWRPRTSKSQVWRRGAAGNRLERARRMVDGAVGGSEKAKNVRRWVWRDAVWWSASQGRRKRKRRGNYGHKESSAQTHQTRSRAAGFIITIDIISTSAAAHNVRTLCRWPRKLLIRCGVDATAICVFRPVLC